ncbi:hypothetical protein IW261DRAFT_1424535 [Armillaria novae-zelandiae]|uniref:Uncharacterized protein n=1 Tax=Armillaria novae-zelandiae TaxID=153914 RepID=A0AA39NUJ3_9AGAR|nr:hypothetical protein IW261DRAFT_1424535 [Armillaria novae-zelandiae]
MTQTVSDVIHIMLRQKYTLRIRRSTIWMQCLIKVAHLDLYPQCLHPWAIPENTYLRKSNIRHMLKAVLDPMLDIKAKSINAANGKTLYVRFMATVTCKRPQGDDNEICQELMKIGELIQEVTMFEDRILNAVGMGDDLAEVQLIREGMQNVERW